LRHHPVEDRTAQQIDCRPQKPHENGWRICGNFRARDDFLNCCGGNDCVRQYQLVGIGEVTVRKVGMIAVLFRCMFARVGDVYKVQLPKRFDHSQHCGQHSLATPICAAAKTLRMGRHSQSEPEYPKDQPLLGQNGACIPE
jgi:hypothetical protein